MKNKWALYIGSGLLVIILFFAASSFYKKEEQNKLNFLAQQNYEIFMRDHSPRFGNTDAKVFLIEYLDPECESCRNFYPLVKELLNEFNGKVQLVVRYAPFHQNSKTAIRALEAARMQGKYWEALETLFYHQPEWGDHHNPQPDKIFDFIAQLGLDMDKLKVDMESESIEKIITQDLQDLQVINVRQTPSFYVNGKPLVEFGIEPLRKLVREEVEKQY